MFTRSGRCIPYRLCTDRIEREPLNLHEEDQKDNNAKYKNDQDLNLVKQHLCGWACGCLLTQLNLLIAGCMLTFIVYVLSEATELFEQLSDYLTNEQNCVGTSLNKKSFTSFIEAHYMCFCLAGPAIMIATLSFYYINLSAEKYCECMKSANTNSS